MLQVSVMLVVCVACSMLVWRLVASLFSSLEELGQLLCGKLREFVGNIRVLDLLPSTLSDGLLDLVHAGFAHYAYVWEIICFQIQQAQRHARCWGLVGWVSV